MEVQNKKIIRPLFILPNLGGGGAERVVLTLLRWLDTEKFDPTLLLLKKEGVYWSEVPEGLKIVYLSDENTRLRESFPAKWGELRSLVKTSDIIIACLELDATYWALGLAKFFRKPVVGWVHTPISQYLTKVPGIHKFLVRFVYPKLDRLVFPSSNAQLSMSSTLGNSKLVNHIIFDPIDLDLIQRKGADTLPEWAPPIFRKKTILGVGRLESEKGFYLLIEAFALACQSGLDANLIILGEGRDRQKLEELVIKSGVVDRVYLPGFVPNPYPFIKASYLFVTPSHIEGFGMAIVEALGLGTPVIANGQVPAHAWILEDGKFGTLTKSNSPEELSGLILQLTNNEDLQKAFSEIGAMRVSSFSASQIAQEWQSLLCLMTNK
jgi:glycosyltransferase involved in cell wall biosynthesis